MKKFSAIAVLLLLPVIFSYAQYEALNLRWQKCLGGTGDDFAKDVLPLTDGGFLIVGDSYSNDGDVTGHHGSSPNSDGWLVRLSRSGNIVWQKSVGGTNHDYFKSVIKTADGNFVAVGSTYSNDGDISGFHGGNDIWAIKFSGNGNLLWSKAYGGSNGDSVGNIVQTGDGGYIITGSTWSTDGNVNSVTKSFDVWYFKIDRNGNFVWGKTMGNKNNDYGEDIRMLPDSNLVFSVSASQDFAGAGDFPPSSPIEFNPWIVKIDTAGNVLWKNCAGSRTYFPNYYYGTFAAPLQLASYGITTVNYGNFTGGVSRGDFNFTMHLSGYNGVSSGLHKFSGFHPNQDDGTRIMVGTPNGTIALPDSGLIIAGKYRIVSVNDSLNRAFLVRKTFKIGVNTDNQVKFFGGSKADAFESIKAISDTEYVVAGYTLSNDGDVSGNHGGSDMWIVKMTDPLAIKKSTIRGLTFIDRNNNDLFDIGEDAFNNLSVKAVRQRDGASFSTIPADGIYFIETDTGTYNVTPVLYNPYYTVSPTQHTTVFNTYGKEDTVLFAVKPIAGKRDYSVSLLALSPVRSGFDVLHQIKYTNQGTDTLNNKTIEWIKDSRFRFKSAIPAATAVSGDTIRWVINNLLPGQSGTIQITGLVIMQTTQNGDTLRSTAYIDSTNDQHTIDNSSTLTQIATGSYDPNDKQENGAGKLTRKAYDAGDYITYTIRFQNTGTDTAFTVIVKDTLDPHFDASTLQMLDASHPYHLQIVDGNKLAWTFNPINLADSNRNEPASHGFISYRVKPKTGLATGDAFANNASIYFDFNPAVKTNTALTYIKPEAPPQPLITGLASSYCSNLGTQTFKLNNLPVGNITTASAKLDGKVLTIAADSTCSFGINNLTSGLHTIEVVYSNSTATQTTTTQFNVEAAVTPDMAVTANITNVQNLTDPVIITAKNKIAGGPAPLYTFAKDRNFVQIIKAESTDSVVTINPANLSIGDNWVHARMTTSVTCYTTKSDTDSIKIVRSPATGIIDIDNPSQLILVYPNPFERSISIKGLNTAKEYRFTLYSQDGKLLLVKKLKNSLTAELDQLNLPAGVYTLYIYDETKKRSLGIVKLLKR